MNWINRWLWNTFSTKHIKFLWPGTKKLASVGLPETSIILNQTNSGALLTCWTKTAKINNKNWSSVWHLSVRVYNLSHVGNSKNHFVITIVMWICVHPSKATHFNVPSIFSGRELAFTFAICYRPSVCLSVVCRLWRWCALLSRLKFSAIFFTVR